MQIIEKETMFQLHKPSAAAIGKFDGIHKGHQSLLRHVLEQKDKGLQAVVFTFDPSPAVLFHKLLKNRAGTSLPELTTKQEKRKLFEELGIDVLIEFPLTYESASMPAERFIEEVLTKQMRAAYIAAGKDLSFGKDGKGDTALLERYAGQCGYRTDIIEKVCLDGVEISSSYVRETVKAGDMEKARELIGEAYSVSGVVAHGKKLGTALGFPTVNLRFQPGVMPPAYGVYAARVYFENGDSRMAVTNVGVRPTVDSGERVNAEGFILDFDGDLYGQTVRMEFYRHLRGERKFPSLDALRDEVMANAEQTRAYFGACAER